MNRLVIVGNGFDLAHGLPTSYKDFIDDYWGKIENSNHNELVEFNTGSYVEFNGHKNLNDLIDLIVPLNGSFKREGINVYKLKDYLKPLADNRIQIIHYKNIFFKLINESTIKNWVDIENIYYKNLKERAKGEINKQNYIWDIKQLNKEFEQVKNLFEKYLKEKVVEKFNFDSLGNDGFIEFYNKFYPDLLGDKFTGLKEAFSDEDKRYIDKMIKEDKQDDVKLHFLCFNYTPTLEKYANSLRESNVNLQLNFIHGEIDNVEDNKINFGFGDEMDEDYRLIENLDDNEYLKNFKSFQYLQNSNYKKLLDFVDNDKFEVLIMGHSCGLSDRTLLNTIFENLNCSLIRVFYYEWHDKTTKEIKDNYTELTQNISRHFNKKNVMRKKIANKTFCEPMPRNKLPLKQNGFHF